MSPAWHLVIFAKAPRLGAVKRRLAVGIGDAAAWRFYRSTTRTLLTRLARDRRWRTWLAVTPDAAARRGRFWPVEIPRLPQGPGDLGRRMTRMLDQCPPGPVVIVGSDIPDIDGTHVARAFALLGTVDAVFGPALDGGYWLVGMRRRRGRRDPFRGVRWSSADALGDTVANLDGRYRVAMLDPLADIDDRAAYEAWKTRRG